MASGQFLDVSLTDWASIATIVGTIVAVVAALVAIIKGVKPIRQSLGQRRFFGWLLTRKDIAGIERNAQNEAATQKAREAAKLADLQFELRNDGGTELVTHNKGPCAARDVTIWGELSPRNWGIYENQGLLRDVKYGRFTHYSAIPSGSSRAEGVSVQQWQVVDGASYWSLRIDWNDDAGPHDDEAAGAHKW